jgi:putative transposase
MELKTMKTFSYKLYAAKRNKYLVRQIELAAEIYNHCIALHKLYYRFTGNHLSIYRISAHVTKLKKRNKYAHWNELNSQAVQDVTERIERAYKLFFSNLKRKVKCSPPHFKKRRKYKSYTLKQSGYKFVGGNEIKIGGRFYKFHKSREIDGNVKTVTVKRDSVGDMYIFVVTDYNAPQVIPHTGKSVGFDFGLKTFLKASDGNDIESPLFFKQNSAITAKLNRSLSRKKKGSNNRNKAKMDLARAHKRIANRRGDFHKKLALQLCSTYSVICIEDLNIKGMQKLWGKKISDLSHSEFVKTLEYTATKTGATVIKIPRFYPSSKTCRVCGNINNDLQLRDRVWVCPDCHTEHDRDFNAAVNIQRVGASTLTGDTVRPA